MPADFATILDIVLACRRIGKFLSGVDEASFLLEEEKHWAVASHSFSLAKLCVACLMSFDRQIRRSHGYNTQPCGIGWPINTMRSIGRSSGSLPVPRFLNCLRFSSLSYLKKNLNL